MIVYRYKVFCFAVEGPGNVGDSTIITLPWSEHAYIVYVIYLQHEGGWGSGGGGCLPRGSWAGSLLVAPEWHGGSGVACPAGPGT